jgi:hypothetical protein
MESANDPFRPPAANTSVPEAPGAKGARVCGILAIIFAVTCIGIPVAIVLGIVALVLHAKAKRLAFECPQEYRTPTNSGMVLGIVGLCMPVVMLPVAGIVSAIAIPALLGQRGRARDKVVHYNVTGKLNDLVLEYEKANEQGASPTEVQTRLESALSRSAALEKNPWSPTLPAYRMELVVVSGQSTSEEMKEAAQNAAANLPVGQAMFLIQYPNDPRGGGGQESPKPGFLAGAARLQNNVDGSNVFVKVADL